MRQLAYHPKGPQGLGFTDMTQFNVEQHLLAVDGEFPQYPPHLTLIHSDSLSLSLSPTHSSELNFSSLSLSLSLAHTHSLSPAYLCFVSHGPVLSWIEGALYRGGPAVWSITKDDGETYHFPHWYLSLVLLSFSPSSFWSALFFYLFVLSYCFQV